MNAKIQSVFLVVLILISLALTRVDFHENSAEAESSKKNWETETSGNRVAANLAYEKASLLGNRPLVQTEAVRNWQVLDPTVVSEAILAKALDGNTPFFYLNTYQVRPLASLTKLITALIVLEDVGLNKKVEISKAAVLTEGEAGNLREGEIYTAQDLLKIMLLASSNDAAVAFEEFLGREQFIKLMNEKAAAIGMTTSRFFDASGLSAENVGSANDLAKLADYLLNVYPEILSITRLESVLVQPINDTRTHIVNNINLLARDPNFLGGKTGTSLAAGENLLVISSFHDHRLLLLILGSRNRFGEAANLINWIEKAYGFQ